MTEETQGGEGMDLLLLANLLVGTTVHLENTSNHEPVCMDEPGRCMTLGQMNGGGGWWAILYLTLAIFTAIFCFSTSSAKASHVGCNRWHHTHQGAYCRWEGRKRKSPSIIIIININTSGGDSTDVI